MFRSTHGDLAILARHINYCTAVGMGTAHVVLEDGSERTAACIGGMCSMMDNECHLLPTTWEWSEDIDVERAEAAKVRAEAKLREEKLSKETRLLTESKLYRALVRIGSARH
jgi:F-type H+-transporting ATPase subunit epsilon